MTEQLDLNAFLDALATRTQAFFAEELGIAVPKGNPELLAEVNKFVKKYKAGEESKKAYDYWFVNMKWWDSVPAKK